jgi:hypothetical protein
MIVYLLEAKGEESRKGIDSKFPFLSQIINHYYEFNNELIGMNLGMNW